MREFSNLKREGSPHVRVIVEVDGNPIGFVELDIERLWPLIHHPGRQRVRSEWIDPDRFDSILQATVVKRLTRRLEQHLYKTLGDEIVSARLEVESFLLKAEGATQAFGEKKKDIEKVVSESGRTMAEFDAFFWDYMLSDAETGDLRKQWKAARTRR